MVSHILDLLYLLVFTLIIGIQPKTPNTFLQICNTLAKDEGERTSFFFKKKKTECTKTPYELAVDKIKGEVTNIEKFYTLKYEAEADDYKSFANDIFSKLALEISMLSSIVTLFYQLLSLLKNDSGLPPYAVNVFYVIFISVLILILLYAAYIHHELSACQNAAKWRKYILAAINEHDWAFEFDTDSEFSKYSSTKTTTSSESISCPQNKKDFSKTIIKTEKRSSTNNKKNQEDYYEEHSSCSKKTIYINGINDGAGDIEYDNNTDHTTGSSGGDVQ